MKNLAQIYKALGDETRLEIVNMLLGKELCVCDIIDAFSLSQPAISHHLKILRQAGILIDTKDGKWVFYSLNPETLKLAEQFLTQVSKKVLIKEHCKPCSPNQL